MLNRRKGGFTKAILGATIMVGLASTPALTSTVAPGATGVAPDTFVTNPGTLLASVSSTLPALTFTASYTESVYRATGLTNGLCGGCINLVIQVSNSGQALITGEIDEISAFNMGSFITDAGINTALGSGVNPIDLSRTGDGTALNFNFSSGTLTPGKSTAFLEIETNAINFGPGTVSAIDGSSFTGPGFSPLTPVTTPLPAALPLFAGGLGALGVLGWRRKRKAAAAA